MCFVFFIQGDSTIYAFEITDEAPHICPLSHHRCATSHQGLSFLTKNHCDVSAVEFAKAFRLTNNTIEPLSFTVPRIKVQNSEIIQILGIILMIFFINLEWTIPRWFVPTDTCHLDSDPISWRMVQLSW